MLEADEKVAINQVRIVEDEPVLREAIVDMLTRDGFGVDAVSSAEEAIEKLSLDVYDVLLTDLRLPEKDGIELLEETLFKYPETVCILMTGHGSIDNAVDAIRKGAFDYVAKPFKLIELAPRIRKGLKQSPLSRS